MQRACLRAECRATLPACRSGSCSWSSFVFAAWKHRGIYLSTKCPPPLFIMIIFPQSSIQIWGKIYHNFFFKYTMFFFFFWIYSPLFHLFSYFPKKLYKSPHSPSLGPGGKGRLKFKIYTPVKTLKVIFYTEYWYFFNMENRLIYLWLFLFIKVLFFNYMIMKMHAYGVSKLKIFKLL